jgi:hypothetical protein
LQGKSGRSSCDQKPFRNTTFGYPTLLDDPFRLVQQQDPEILIWEIADQSLGDLKSIVIS